jgi:alpha-L-rhamnosidase
VTSTLATNDAASILRRATWISAPEAGYIEAGSRPAYEFRVVFSISEDVARAILTATAHGIYEAFINGDRVGDRELTPGLTSYHSTLYAQRYPVASMLRSGANELRLVVSDGWFRGRCGASRIPDHFGTQTAVIALLDIELGGGSRMSVATDETWEVGVGSIVAADLMDGQRVDLRRASITEWSSVQLADTALTRNEERLAVSLAPPVRRVADYPAVSVSRLPTGRQIVDFGTTVNGWVRLRNLGASGVQTELVHGEWLLDDGDLDTVHAAYTRWPEGGLMTLGQHDTVISRGHDDDTFEPRHTTHGFRYVAIDGRDDDISPGDITAIMVRSDLRETARFRSNDERLNRLHQITVQSWLVNSCDVPTDCPQRERWGYTGDFQIFAHTAAFLEDIDLFGRKWLQSLSDDQHESGLITNVAPMCGVDPIIPHSLDGAAGWGDSATVVPWELYLAYGDIEILRSNIDMMRKWVAYVTDRAKYHRHPSREAQHPTPQPHEEFIWDTGWQWGEWLEPDTTWDPTLDQAIVATAYFKRSAEILGSSLTALGDVEGARAYFDLAERVAEAWRLEFIDQATGRLTNDRQAHYVRALAFNLVAPADRQGMLDRLVALIDEADGHLTTGFLSTGMLLPTLAQNDRIDVAYRLLRQDTAPSWMTMLDRGATTVWEAWEGVDSEGRAHASLAHYSKGAVIDFIHEYAVGLRQAPGSAGWERFIVAPRPDSGLEWAGLSYDSRRGRIEVEWIATPSGLDITLTVPPGATADVSTPAGGRWLLQAGTHRVSD